MDLLTIEVDNQAVLRALEEIPDVVARHLKPEAEETARRIVKGAQQRVRRATGVTAAGIHHEESHDGTGYVVLAWDQQFAARLWNSGNNDRVNAAVPRFLEFGTVKMSAYPFFFDAARLEEQDHDRRARQAVIDAIEEVGLGE